MGPDIRTRMLLAGEAGPTQCGVWDRTDPDKASRDGSITTNLSPSMKFTAEFWLKMATLPAASGHYEILQKYNTGAASSHHQYRIELRNDSGTRSMRGIVRGGSSNLFDNFRWTLTPSVDVWAHYAMSVDLTQPNGVGRYRLYKDGATQGNPTITTQQNPPSMNSSASANFCLGLNDASGTNGLTGKLFDVRFWSGIVRTGTEVNDNKDGLVTVTTGGNWRLQGDVTDSSVDANHLTNSGVTFAADTPY